MEEYITFRAGDELLTLPASVLTGSKSQLAWLWTRHIPNYAKSDAFSRLMWEVYKNHESVKRPLEYVPWMTPRRITAFQFWLRNRLTRWGLI